MRDLMVQSAVGAASLQVQAGHILKVAVLAGDQYQFFGQSVGGDQRVHVANGSALSFECVFEWAINVSSFIAPLNAWKSQKETVNQGAAAVFGGHADLPVAKFSASYGGNGDGAVLEGIVNAFLQSWQ
ncbi:MAG: hypothetical protein IPO43_17090 [Rhodoferax sp.]|nr:hypothetical protein [Rhodoferax sp.]